MTPEQWQEAIDTQLARLDWLEADDKAALRFVMLEMLPRWSDFLTRGGMDPNRANAHRAAATSCLADMTAMLGRYSALIERGDVLAHKAMIVSWVAELVGSDHQPQGSVH